ncbi:DUF2189 domain-containing protein [Thauera phenolivorans]|uniref:DUF2189 domain-containing protein n=1 Tax=Thauera phenolivorans TaxID=1792543 RepID=UPI00083AA1A4|nr:DUF2189 domain-containing protein [Thauera phenolivorans]
MPTSPADPGPQSAPEAGALRPAPIRMCDLAAAFAEGVAVFRAVRGLSMAFAAIFALLGLILFVALELMSLAPLSLSLAGGFMLLAPALLAGFFAIDDRHRQGGRPGFADIRAGFARMPRGGWVVSFVCALLFLIWMTDAGTLYGFMVGQVPSGFGRLFAFDTDIARFTFFSSIMGAVLAFIIFTVSAFSIPLIYDGRATLVSGVAASVRTVFTRFPVVMSWALAMAVAIIVSALLLPLLVVSLPVAAYTGRALYRRLFPG